MTFEHLQPAQQATVVSLAQAFPFTRDNIDAVLEVLNWHVGDATIALRQAVALGETPLQSAFRLRAFYGQQRYAQKIETLERVIERADADKGGDDA